MGRVLWHWSVTVLKQPCRDIVCQGKGKCGKSCSTFYVSAWSSECEAHAANAMATVIYIIIYTVIYVMQKNGMVAESI